MQNLPSAPPMADTSMEISQIIALLRDRLHTHETAVEEWLTKKRAEAPPFLYNSVDLRHAGFKIAPVDTNLFPAGFNNLSVAAVARAVTQMGQHVTRVAPGARNILIIPENHTRNLAYLDNLRVLHDLLTRAGFAVRIGSLAAGAGEVLELTSLSGHVIKEYGVERAADGRIHTGDFTPDVLVMNHDFTGGIPEILHNAAQPMIPPPALGWHTRRKSTHFTEYNNLARELADILGVDDWLISTPISRCGAVDFGERSGVECVALNVEKTLHVTRRKYQEYGITQEPYVFIKADGGTYGMGIMTARSGDDVLALNKKTRNKMDIIKEGTHNTEVIIQEGVPSVDVVEGAAAEPMIYLVDGVPVGGAYRLNDQRGDRDNLNATGMRFTGMCDEGEGDAARARIKSCNFKVFGLISAVAALATARERY